MVRQDNMNSINEKTKIIAFHLPQFHTFPENDKWWGKGFTEWTNTRKAKPLFEGHYQPHTPYKEDYYDLSDITTMKRQIEDAKKYGIYGFCFYHYWFTKGKTLMEKPIEDFLENKELDIHFCLSWANEPWTRRWNGGFKDVIMPQEYGNKMDWKMHFDYLLPYFKDKRYIYEDDMPMLLIYRPEIIPCFDEMIEYWQELAKEKGFKGLYIMAQGANFCAKRYSQRKKIKDNVNGYIMYEPGFTLALMLQTNPLYLMKNVIKYWDLARDYIPTKIKGICYRILKMTPKKPIHVCDFSLIWNSILKHECLDSFYPGAFANWDNTARRGLDARIITGSTPEIFKEFFKKQCNRAVNEYKKNYIFFTAWNEWAEGSHLEADERYGFQYLEAVREVVMYEKKDIFK